MSTHFLLLEAVRSEDLGFLQDFIKENYNEININDRDDDGVTVAHIAAGLEKNILEYLLNHGSEMDSQTQDGLTPLHIAAMWGRSEQVATLLNHRADCSIVDNNGYNALMHAVDCQEDGGQACVDLILSYLEKRDSYISDQNEFSTSKGRPGSVQTTPESQVDFEKLNGSPWITPRRRSKLKNSRRDRVGVEKTSQRLSTKFESLSTEEHATEMIETSCNSQENFNELLTELSSGLLSSSGHGSSADSNSLTFSYSTITCLASLTNIGCSEYGTVHDYGSDILTECSTSDDLSTEEQENKDVNKIVECGRVNGGIQELGMGWKGVDGVTDEDTCNYETADEEIQEDLKRQNQNGYFADIKKGRIGYGRVSEGNIQGMKENNKGMKSENKFSEAPLKEDMKQVIQAMEGLHIEKADKVGNVEKINKRSTKEEGEAVKCVSIFDGGQAREDIEARQAMKKTIGKENIVRHNLSLVGVEENNADEEMNKKNSTYAVENNRSFEENKKERYLKAKKYEKEDVNYKKKKDKIENEDNDLEQFEEEKQNDVSFVEKEQHNDSFNPDNNDFFNPKIDQSGLPFNSTFLVDSPLQHSKQPANFFIPIQSNKLSISKGNALASNPRTNNGEETIIYDWRELSMQQRNETMAIIPACYKKMSCNELRQKIKSHGQIPGPITHQTKMLYVKKLWKLDQGIGKHAGKDSTPVNRYPVEIRMILTGKAEIPDFNTLEQDMVKEFCKSPRKVQWRGGTEKSSFNYLLLDPRVTLDLPQRIKKLSSTEAFCCFILSIFYVGKGKRSRPYAHLHEAVKYAKSKSNQKLDQIWEIWRDGMGVISLHLFQSAIPVEAFTREACMVEALGLSQLTNQKRGEYYGLCASLELKKKRKLGIFFLYKAFQIFLQEGERQICKEDL